MSEPLLHADGLGKRYGSNVGAARLHARDPGGLGDRARRPERRRQDDAAAARGRALRSRAPAACACSGARRATRPRELLPRVGFVAQEHPLHRGFTIGETLQARPRAQPELGRRRSRASGSSASGCRSTQKVGKLSGGQQAQVALTLALAKRPELLLLDEPVASLDPLARREFLNTVMEAVSETGMTRHPLVAHRRRPRARLRPPRDPLPRARPARRADRRDRRRPPAADRAAQRPGDGRARARGDPREPHRAPDVAARARQRPRLRRVLGAARGRPRGDRARLPRPRHAAAARSREAVAG